MDKHTFLGKRKVCVTEICDFTDYQGIGGDPMYKRYESVLSIINKIIDPKYAHFLAAPHFVEDEDLIRWHISEWNELPERLTTLTGDKARHYQKIKDVTVAHYQKAIEQLTGEERRVLTGALSYINDEFIFCVEDKVYLVAWGMVPDTRKHIAIGELIHESPTINKFRIFFEAGEYGSVSSKLDARITLPEGSVISENDIPSINPIDGYTFQGWKPNPLGVTVNSDLTFTAEYSEQSVTPPIVVVSEKEVDPPIPSALCKFSAGEHGNLEGESHVYKPLGSNLLKSEIPSVAPTKGYTFVGWNIDPVKMTVNGDTYFEAQYEKRTPWYKRLWLFLTGHGCFKWLLWLLLLLLIICFVNALLKGGCTQCHREDIVHPIDSEKGGEDDENPIDPEKGGEDDENPIDPEKGGEDDENPIDPEKGGEDDENPIDPEKGGEDDENPIDPEKGGEDDENPIDSEKGGEDDENLIDSEKGGEDDFTDSDSGRSRGYVKPLPIRDGRLPDKPSITPPVQGDDGGDLPIYDDPQPGVPPVVGNRLFVFLEDSDDTVDAFAADFKKAYPSDKYGIIGFDRRVNYLVIQVPVEEREKIRKGMNSQIKNHRFLVFDEVLYNTEGLPSSKGSTSEKGWHLKAVNAPEAWKITKGSSDVIVAIVDDGFDIRHSMFKGRIVKPYNVHTQNEAVDFGSGHGTHVAGCAVGSLSCYKQGAAGIAPNCKIMPVQVFLGEQCTLSSLLTGIMYALHNGAHVINISVGSKLQGLAALPEDVQKQFGREQRVNEAKLWEHVFKLAHQKNVIIVFAAGNDNIQAIAAPENRPNLAITVGAVNSRFEQTEFSNHGEATEISAPGKSIFSSIPKNRLSFMDGTSMAAPIVAGAVALMKSEYPDLTTEQAINVLVKTGKKVKGDLPPMIQVDRALRAVKNRDFNAPSNPGNECDDSSELTPRPRPDPSDPYAELRRRIREMEQELEELYEQLPERTGKRK